DSSLSITINSAGYNQQKAVLNPSQRETTLVMQPASVALAKSKTKTAQNRIILEGATPLDGWQPIDSYLDSIALSEKEIQNKTGGNEVVLSFDVAADGTAVDIIIDKPLCPACDSTAVRVIKKSTQWKKTTPNSRAKAYIRF
ncbi:MAG TPA: hypothetical protein VM010_02555, partial [Chitinophagaceae bacterium]|nr:hypothetical protein [Chitinophagaceae bacterium]